MGERLTVLKSIIAPTEEQRRFRSLVSNAADKAREDILTNPRASLETVDEVLDEIKKNEKKMKAKINRGQDPFESEDTQ